MIPPVLLLKSGVELPRDLSIDPGDGESLRSGYDQYERGPRVENALYS